MCEVVSFRNFENSLTTVKVMMKTKVAPFLSGTRCSFSALCCWLLVVIISYYSKAVCVCDVESSC